MEHPGHPAYLQTLMDGGLFPPFHKDEMGSLPPVPSNLEQLRSCLMQRRSSLMDSSSLTAKWEKFVVRDSGACDEEAVKHRVLSLILADREDACEPMANTLFTNMVPILEPLSQAKPDYYYGTPPLHIRSRVRHELSRHIIPSKHTDRSAVPNFFLEANGVAGFFWGGYTAGLPRRGHRSASNADASFV